MGKKGTHGPHINNDILEFEVDMERKKWTVTNVCMSKEGEVIRTHNSFNDIELGFQLYSNAPEVYLWWVVETDNLERSIRVVNEKRIQILAHNIWGDQVKTRELFSREPKKEEK